MFKLSRMTDYGVVLLCYMAQRSDARSTAPELAERTGLPAPTVSKILKALTKADILSATRGAQGGYAIARAPESVTVAQIIAALDGPVALTALPAGPRASPPRAARVMPENSRRVTPPFPE